MPPWLSSAQFRSRLSQLSVGSFSGSESVLVGIRTFLFWPNVPDGLDQS